MHVTPWKSKGVSWVRTAEWDHTVHVVQRSVSLGFYPGPITVVSKCFTSFETPINICLELCYCGIYTGHTSLACSLIWAHGFKIGDYALPHNQMGLFIYIVSCPVIIILATMIIKRNTFYPCEPSFICVGFFLCWFVARLWSWVGGFLCGCDYVISLLVCLSGVSHPSYMAHHHLHCIPFIAGSSHWVLENAYSTREFIKNRLAVLSA